MGARGPAPVREEERRRVNAPEHPVTKLGPDELEALPFDVDLSPEPPDPLIDRDGEKWHPYAQELWERLQRDPSRVWQGPAAMALDMAMCEQLSRLLQPRVAGIQPASEFGEGGPVFEKIPMNGSEMAAILKWASARGLYEADRLRINKEITFYSRSDDDVTVSEGAEVVSIHANRSLALAE